MDGLSKRARDERLLRWVGAGVFVALAVILHVGDSSSRLLATVGLCVAVVVGSMREKGAAAAAVWTVVAIAAFSGAAAVRHSSGSWTWLDALVSYALVPTGLVLLAQQSRALVGRLTSALATGEVARAKLVRANRELGASMENTEAALAKLGTIVDSVTEGLLAVSAAGQIEIANSAVASLLGIEGLARGAVADDVLPTPMCDLIRACFDADDAAVKEITLPADRSAMAAASPIRLQGALWGVVVLVRDVTLQKEVDRMKSDFTATVSHEMRTPLTSVLGFSKMIGRQLESRVFPSIPAGDARASAAASKIRKNLEIIVEEGQRLSELINDVLDLSQIESDQLVWDLQPNPASALLEAATELGEARFGESPDVTFVVDVAPDLPVVLADRARVQQVVSRLLDNAAKFTESGTITLGAHQEADDVVFSVRDTGIGVPATDRESIFEKFKQVGDALTDRPQGTGLGLPICKGIVQRHGGRIWVEETPGGGSCFRFTLPAAAASAQDEGEHGRLGSTDPEANDGGDAE